MSELAEKLGRLRQQAGLAQGGAFVEAERKASRLTSLPPEASRLTSLPPEASRLTSLPQEQRPEPAPTRPAVPESIRRMLGIRTRALASPAPSRPPDRELPGYELAPGLRYRELHFDGHDAPEYLDASFAKGYSGIHRRDVLAFDTETTGLAGGTGTRAFMIGVADWVEASGERVAACGDRAGERRRSEGVQGSREGIRACAGPTAGILTLRVRQLFLTEMRGEAAMLDAFAAWLAPSTVLVSYNGRCYDAPLLDTRYRLARRRSPLAGLAHVDLLFPSRRRWRGRWENCRLATIERHVLGVLRDDDLPGSEAPRAWLDWLRGNDARDFRRVLAHNEQDVRSLAQLLLRLAEPTHA